MKIVNETVHEMVEEQYQAHLNTFDSENIRDFTDAYIKQQLGIWIVLNYSSTYSELEILTNI